MINPALAIRTVTILASRWPSNQVSPIEILLITLLSLQKVPDSDSDRPAVQVGFENGALKSFNLIGPLI